MASVPAQQQVKQAKAGRRPEGAAVLSAALMKRASQAEAAPQKAKIYFPVFSTPASRTPLAAKMPGKIIAPFHFIMRTPETRLFVSVSSAAFAFMMGLIG